MRKPHERHEEIRAVMEEAHPAHRVVSVRETSETRYTTVTDFSGPRTVPSPWREEFTVEMAPKRVGLEHLKILISREPGHDELRVVQAEHIYGGG